MSFKPMLAGKCTDVTKLTFPVLASLKLDGVRCLVIGGRLMSRTLKPIPNSKVQALFKGLPDGTDGELILGDPTAPDAYRKTVSAVMGDGNPIEGLRYWVFDNFNLPGGFQMRFNYLKTLLLDGMSGVKLLTHSLCPNVESLNLVEELAVAEGHEGIMVRSLDGPYKQGRSTEKEGYLLKIKRFEDAEAIIIGYEERMHNGNEAKKNAVGRTERSTAQDGLTGRGDLGALIVRGINGTYKYVEFKIGTGFDDKERLDIWSKRDIMMGMIIKYQYFPTGSKDKPRFPTWLGFRYKIDMDEED
jgi:DNA ligase-1